MNKDERQDLILQLVEEQEGKQLLSTRDLASQLDVSEMTVRRDLQELSDRGLVRRLHGGVTSPQYRPHPDKHHPSIGILIGTAKGKYANPFFNLVLEGAEKRLKEAGYAIAFITTIVDVHTVEQARALLQQHPVDGMMLLGGPKVDSMKYFKKQVHFIVTIPGLLHAHHDAVQFDGFTGMKLMVNHLAGLGHKRIAYIAGNFDPRYEGYAAGLHENGLAFDETLCVEVPYGLEGWMPEIGRTGAERLMALSDPPTALACGSDRIAVGAIQWLRQNGYDIPGDIAVTGCDNLPDSEFMYPPLTTVNIHKEIMGRLGAERLISRISNPDELPLRIITPVELVIRSSCGAKP